MLLLHANVDITFDLAAIRSTARGQRAVQFLATVLNCQWGQPASTSVVADIWVLIDGELRFSRTKLQKIDGPIQLNIPLEPNDRFLTLISTDGGDAIAFDEITYLNPRIVLKRTSPEGGVSGN